MKRLTRDELIYLVNFLMVEAVPGFFPPRGLPKRRKQIARERLVKKQIIESTAKGQPWVAGSDSLTQSGANIAFAIIVAALNESTSPQEESP